MSNKRSHVQLFNPPAEKYYARKRVNEPLRVPVAPPCAPLRQDRRTPDAPTAPRCHDGVSGDSNGGREEEEGEEEGGKEEGGRGGSSLTHCWKSVSSSSRAQVDDSGNIWKSHRERGRETPPL